MITKSPSNIQSIKWPTASVLAFTTNRLPTNNQQTSNSAEYALVSTTNTEKFSSEFDAFNLGDHVGDCPNTVARNRKLLLNYLPINTKIQWLDQVHGNNVVVVEEHENTPIVADAAITRSQNIALAIMTADCLPILLSNQNGSEIAAIHAGWKPLAANVISRTLSNMSTENKNIHAWLGPCIGTLHFEVGVEVKQAFCEMSPTLSLYFTNSSVHKYHADLAGIATYLLEKAGVVSITHHQECTFANKSKYYSYRRDYKTGRMASIICLNK